MNWTAPVGLPHLAEVPLAAPVIMLTMVFVFVRGTLSGMRAGVIFCTAAELAVIAVFGVYLSTAPLWLAAAGVVAFIGIGLNGLLR